MTQHETAPHTALQRLRYQAELLAALHRFDVEILTSRGAQEIGGVALEHLERLVPSERSVVKAINPASESRYFLATRGEDPTGGASGSVDVAAAFPAQFDAIRAGVPVVVDLAGVAGVPVADAHLAAGFRTMLMAPLVSGSLSPIGFIGLARRSEAGFNASEIEAARLIAGRTTVALHAETLREDGRWLSSSATASGPPWSTRPPRRC